MTDHILDGYNLEGMTFPTRAMESDLWAQSVPNFCPRCDEIRGSTDGGTPLGTNTQTLMFKSFGMCSQCYTFQRDHPAEAQANIETFRKKQEEIAKQKLESVKAHRYRVYLFEPNEKLPNSPYATSTTTIQFTKYPTMTSKGSANHSIPLLSEDEAKKVVETLESKGLTCWYDDSDYQKQLTMK